MFKLVIKFFLFFVSLSLIHLGYLYLTGEKKPYYCMTECNSTFELWSSAIPPFVIGCIILWKMLNNIFKNKEKLIKKGKYCFKEKEAKEPYCCKCYNDGVISKLKKLDGEYMCINCDYAAFYLKTHSVDDIDLNSIDDVINKR